ncbi:unnamed protein product [Cladocopium goreaui]|uniref:Copia protein n=1 Tax=Cladocopium goreaui TaxID=2562237 RepID=A0A9P1CWK4_9DINO|nr:unnamed protein product [Cladocopium goreaui]
MKSENLTLCKNLRCRAPGEYDMQSAAQRVESVDGLRSTTSWRMFSSSHSSLSPHSSIFLGRNLEMPPSFQAPSARAALGTSVAAAIAILAFVLLWTSRPDPDRVKSHKAELVDPLDQDMLSSVDLRNHLSKRTASIRCRMEQLTGQAGYDVERMLSRLAPRSDKHRCMILPLREDFTIREVSVDVRLQIGYDIQGKHLATILNPHSFDDIDFQSEAMYQVSDVVVCLASGPSPAKLCMLRTGLPDPAFFAMITPFSEALNAVQEPPEPASPGTARRSVWADLDTDTRRTTDQRGRRRSSPAVMVIDADRNPSPTRNAPVLSAVPSLETLQRKRQKKFKVPSHSSLSGLSDISHGNQTMSMMRIASIKSQQGKTPSRMASDSRLISESLIYSIDSYTDGHSSDGFWVKELRDVNIQTEASTADSECQTDPIYSGIGALCRRCQRPPKIPMKRQGSGMYRKRLSSGGDPVDFLDTSEASEDFAALSPAEVLIQRIQGFWVLHQGPKNTAPWLQSFLVRGSEAESQEDALEIRTESERVYMAGGVTLWTVPVPKDPQLAVKITNSCWLLTSLTLESPSMSRYHSDMGAVMRVMRNKELSLDEDPDGALEGLDGLLHRYGQSGTHLVYTRRQWHYLSFNAVVPQPDLRAARVCLKADRNIGIRDFAGHCQRYSRSQLRAWAR